jgi:hypothetical protein
MPSAPPTTQVARDSMTRTKRLSPPALSTGPARIMLATFTHRTREDEQAQPPHVPDVTCCRKQPVVHRRTGSQRHANPHRSHDTSNDQLLPTKAGVAEIVAAKALPEEHPALSATPVRRPMVSDCTGNVIAMVASESVPIRPYAIT